MPVIACDCATCTSDDPRDRRTRTGACVQWIDARGNERVVLIDATPDLRQQSLRHELWRCDAVLFTHNHVDHIFGLDEVRRFNAVMQAPIDVYAERHTMEALRRVYKHVFEQEGNVNRSFVASLIPHEIGPEQAIELWGVRFTPIRLLHGRLPILGFRIERVDGEEEAWMPLGYCTDVSAVPPETWGRLEGLGTLVLDCLRWRHHPTHLTVDQAVEMADRIGAGRTWFVHMAHQVKHAETQERLPKGMSLAWDGLVLGD
ncbi:MAG: MBL fold metallo-hydrolase [Planctomycetota bacterium]|nr:MBL fold metallo-hydrolase [Planctomycetota bacterium]